MLQNPQLHYLDNAATTIVAPEVADVIDKAMREHWANPSSLYGPGARSEEALNAARAAVARTLGCKSRELYFTSCGSESNNQAIFGLAKLRARRSKRIITSDSEHPSVSAPLAALEDEGWEIVRIPTLGGKLCLQALEAELSKGCAFVTIMLANNETGAKYDIPAVRKAIDKSGSGALLHCDAVQGFLKVSDKREITKNCDLASISAHKIGGFKGVGALYIKSGIKLTPFIRGGGQEGGLRSGTENIIGISSFAGAAEDFNTEVTAHISELYNHTVSLLEGIDGVALHIPENHVDTVLLISVLGVRSEVMLNALNLEGICVSAGSACSARKGVTHAMASFGLS